MTEQVANEAIKQMEEFILNYDEKHTKDIVELEMKHSDEKADLETLVQTLEYKLKEKKVGLKQMEKRQKKEIQTLEKTQTEFMKEMEVQLRNLENHRLYVKPKSDIKEI
tara:strand:+ start:619 stop:945 length:327 start_codon:yes stop_codon:yes gene_type:complete